MLNVHTISLLVVCSVGLSAGQILFKVAARSAGESDRFLLALGMSPAFILALVIYASMTILWAYILTVVPLSRAYPFAVLSFIFVPLAANWLFLEPLTIRYLIGLTMIAAGLLLTTTS